eukprot:m.67341 g.67341  ORF g.67341 m.67341 type:complete len:159 (-) comp12703_c0_seq2:90-566(-)
MAVTFWQVPALVHACSIARVATIDIQELEAALEEKEPSPFLIALHTKLLHGLRAATLQKQGWEEALRAELVEQTGDEGVLEGKAYRDLTLGERVELLHSLCEWRAMDAESSGETLLGSGAEALRVQPLGQDRDGNTYWHFAGLRLYKEAPRGKGEESG